MPLATNTFRALSIHDNEVPPPPTHNGAESNFQSTPDPSFNHFTPMFQKPSRVIPPSTTQPPIYLASFPSTSAQIPQYSLYLTAQVSYLQAYRPLPGKHWLQDK